MHAYASVYLEDFTHENRKFYVGNSGGYNIGVTDGVYRFDYSDAGSSDAAVTASAQLYHKYIQADERMYMEFDFETNDTAKSTIQYEFKNYDTDNGGTFVLALKNGKVLINSGEITSYAGSSGTFTIDATTDENETITVKVYLNGELIHTHTEQSFSLRATESGSGVQFRIYAIANIPEGETGPIIDIDNVKTVVDEEPPTGIYVGEPEFMFDFGDEVDGKTFYTMSEYLYPAHSVKSVRQIANFTQTNQSYINLIAQQGDDDSYNLGKTTLNPAEVVLAEIETQCADLDAASVVDTYVWRSLIDLAPISGKNSASYNGEAVGTAEELAAHLNTVGATHPRLFGTKSEFDTVTEKVNTDETYSEMFATLRAEADAMLDDAVPVHNVNINNMADILYNRLTLLGFMYASGQGDQYAACAMNNMYAVSQFADWYDGNSFLLTGHYALAMAHGYDLIYDYLCDYPTEKAAIEKAIHDKAIVPALEVYRADVENTWARRVSNWNLIPNGGIGVACLAIGNVNEYSQDCSIALNYAIRGYRYAMQGFDRNGSWYEGLGYYSYMMNFATDFLASLENTMGDDYGYFDYEGFRNSSSIPLKLSGSDYIWSYADATYQVKNQYPTLMFFAKYSNMPGLGRARLDQIAANGNVKLKDLLWYDASFKTAAGLDENYGISEDTYYPDMQMIALHSDYGDTQAFVGTEAGPNSGGHLQTDMGGFVYDAQGEQWFVDLGLDNYSLYGYFSSDTRRYYYRMRAEGHNCMVFNPDVTPGQVSSATGSVTDYEFTDAASWAVMDLSSAYAEDASSFNRMVYLDKQTQGFAVKDTFTLKGTDNEYYWFAHTPATIELSEDKKTAILTKASGKQLKVQLQSEGEFSVMSATTLLTGDDDPDNWSENISANLRQNEKPSSAGISKLTVHATGMSGDCEIIVTAVPLDSDGNGTLPDVSGIAF